jgi:hypothetical protein
MLARFQATGGMAGDDLLTAGPGVMPRAWTGWLRSRPTGPVLNLIRKELRLLRPVWLVSLLSVVGWVCLIVYGLAHGPQSSKPFTLLAASANWPAVVWVVGVCSTLMISIFAGSLSLGEERTSGTHSWHLTLPVSAFRQWLIKLSMALFAGLAGAWLVPILLLAAGASLSGTPFRFVDVDFGIFWLLLVLLLSFAAFWCACAANGTVSAVLWVFPAMIALGLASDFGMRAAYALVDFLVSRFDLFASFRVACAVASTAKFFPSYRIAHAAGDHMGFGIYEVLAGAIMFVPAVLFAIVQSYRLFRAQVQGRTLSVVRSLLPLIMLVFLCSLGLSAYFTFVSEAAWRVEGLTRGTHEAIEKILPTTTNQDAAQPLQLTVDDLAEALARNDGAKDSPFLLTESTRRWLHNSRITVTPNKAHPRDYCCGGNGKSIYWWYYLAIIHTADGTDLTLSYEPPTQGDRFPRPRFCVHWQGGKGQEELWDGEYSWAGTDFTEGCRFVSR